MLKKLLLGGSLLSIPSIIAQQQQQQQQQQDQTTPSTSKSSSSSSTFPSYGIDMSFAHSSPNSISTNYAWLPHNSNTNTSSSQTTTPIPEQYQNMPIQYLGNRQEVYENFIDGCRHYWEEELVKNRGEKEGSGVSACNSIERQRIEQNLDQPISMVNYTDVGYKKIKAPEHVFKMISDFWKTNKDKESDEEWGEGNIYVNYWDNPSKMISVNDRNLVGGGQELHDSIWNVTKDLISEWTGQELQGSSVYGIRVYKEGAILSPHVDRLPLISSAIINVAQDVDEEWPLEVIGHDGKATNVTMEPGDMVLYESHSVLHGRPFALKGRFFANIFIHFMPIPSEEQIHEHELPPYILRESKVASQWEDGEFENDIPGAPSGRHDEHHDEHWGQHDAHDAAGDGDLDKLIEIAKVEQEALHFIDKNGWQPIHEAVRSGEEDVIEFLMLQGADLNSVTDHGKGESVLDIAIGHWGDDNEYIDWLRSLGATITRRFELDLDLGPEL